MDTWESARREAVRAAEQIVSDAWIGQLLLAESEARVMVDICVHVRPRLAERLRTAQRAGDAGAVVESQTKLETANGACEMALQTYVQVRELLAQQLKDWARATRRRIAQAQADWQTV